MRQTTYENRKARFESGRMVFTIEQIEDVLGLVLDGKRPDGSYGDDECELWLMLWNNIGER